MDQEVLRGNEREHEPDEPDQPENEEQPGPSRPKKQKFQTIADKFKKKGSLLKYLEEQRLIVRQKRPHVYSFLNVDSLYLNEYNYDRRRFIAEWVQDLVGREIHPNNIKLENRGDIGSMYFSDRLWCSFSIKCINPHLRRKLESKIFTKPEEILSDEDFRILNEGPFRDERHRYMRLMRDAHPVDVLWSQMLNNYADQNALLFKRPAFECFALEDSIVIAERKFHNVYERRTVTLDTMRRMEFTFYKNFAETLETKQLLREDFFDDLKAAECWFAPPPTPPPAPPPSPTLVLLPVGRVRSPLGY